jgi:hypothetical protein
MGALPRGLWLHGEADTECAVVAYDVAVVRRDDRRARCATRWGHPFVPAYEPVRHLMCNLRHLSPDQE